MKTIIKSPAFTFLMLSLLISCTKSKSPSTESAKEENEILSKSALNIEYSNVTKIDFSSSIMSRFKKDKDWITFIRKSENMLDVSKIFSVDVEQNGKAFVNA